MGAKLNSQNGSCSSSEADGPGGRGGGERRRGRASPSRSRRLLRSPSSLALTDGPAAPWGGLRTLVGGMGELFRPHITGTLRAGCGPAFGSGEGGARGERSELARRGRVFTLIRPLQDVFFCSEPDNRNEVWGGGGFHLIGYIGV